jgi:short chain dehydrogenase
VIGAARWRAAAAFGSKAFGDKQEMTRPEQAAQSRAPPMRSSFRSDQLISRNRNDHGFRTKSRNHHRCLAGHRRELVEAFATSATEWSPIRARSAKPLSFAIPTSSPSTAILPVPRPPSAIARFGRIDTLVNNAGILIAKPCLDYSEADFAAISAVNLAGFFQMSQKAIFAMLRAGSGHVINITATIAEQPMVSVAAALATLTKGGLKCRPVSGTGALVTGEILHVDGGASAGRW